MTTTQTPPRNRLERETKFLQAISNRIKDDTGAKAIFKRALSGEHHHLRKVYAYTLPYLADVHERQQDIWIFGACLYTYHDQKTEPAPRNFAQSCLDLQNQVPSNGPERRFRTLLDTTLIDIESPITALVRQFKSQEVKAYYPQLIADLCHWDHPDQFVQDSWAKTFWRVAPSSGKSAPA
jgi:CRISPR system Cascade subunit CasB